MKVAKMNGAPEAFLTVQGEGRNVGQPSIFVRLSRCNLHCVWCDTPYTWNWEGTKWSHVDDTEGLFPEQKKYNREAETILLTPEQIVALVKELDVANCQHVVFTGGEPMMQQKELVKVLRLLREEDGWYCEVETNGTIAPSPEFNSLIDQYNVSPKLANSANDQKLRERPKVYQALVANPKATFKYVVCDETDLAEVEGLIARYSIPPNRIFLMPEGTTEQEIAQKERWIVEVCKSKGWNFSTRLQVHLWGALRGV